MIKIIDYVANNKGCSRDNIALYFHMKKLKTGEYEDRKAPFGYRTLRRYLSELVQEKIFLQDKNDKNEACYSISSYMIDIKKIENHDFSKMLLMLLECGEFRVSKLIQEYLQKSADEVSKDVVEHYIRVIHEDDGYKKQEDIINIINEAILKKHDISFEYSGQRKFITPICFLRNKNGTKLYLYGVRKKRLLPPFQIEKISDIYDKLPKLDFVRCHNSYIVYLPAIRELQKDEIIMEDGTKIVISRSFRKEVKQAFSRWALTQMI